ncbi:MAG: DUF4157 domain-containing protein [Paeniglutamicibacter terrestris]
MENRERLRQVCNAINLSTLSGLGLARATGCEIARGPRGLILARFYRPALPKAGAFTVGNVIFFRPSLSGAEPRRELLSHEETHATQYAWCLGLPFLPLYFLAAGYSLLRTGDPASRNVFERGANLQAGGYLERPTRKLLPVIVARLRRHPVATPTSSGDTQ